MDENSMIETGDVLKSAPQFEYEPPLSEPTSDDLTLWDWWQAVWASVTEGAPRLYLDWLRADDAPADVARVGAESGETVGGAVAAVGVGAAVARPVMRRSSVQASVVDWLVGQTREQWWWGALVAAAFAVAWLGQLTISGGGNLWAGALMYITAAVVVGVGLWRLLPGWVTPIAMGGAEQLALLPEADGGVAAQSTPAVRWTALVLGLVFSGLTYVASGNNFFSPTAMLFWVASLVSWAVALWDEPLRVRLDWRDVVERMWRGEIVVRVSRTGWLLLAVMVLAATVRYAQLDTVPGDMTSDHVEKVLDVYRIMSDPTFRPVFLANNGGREPLMFYVSAIVGSVLQIPASHMLLKLVSATVGLLTIPIVFLLAKEMTDDDRIALLSVLMLALMWWANSISRNGLRFPWSPFFSALALLFLARGVKYDRPAQFVLAGLMVGLGVYGYTPSRIMPLVVGVFLLLWWLHHFGRDSALTGVWRLSVVGVVSVAVAIPLLRYIQDFPQFFWYRTVTRVAGEEGVTVTSVGAAFAQNVANSLRMFSLTSDNAWLVSPVGLPALDWVMGGLFHLGAAAALVWYLRGPKRETRWFYLFLLVGLPVLLLPSILALAFPIENPSLHRSGAALPGVAILLGLGADALWRGVEGIFRGRVGVIAGALVVGVMVWTTYNNNNRILFDIYARQYDVSVQNASGIGAVVRAWATSVGDWNTVWVRPYPYWVDTRGVGIEAGNIGWDNVVYAEAGDKFEDTLDDPRPKLFIVNIKDAAALSELRALYPNGVLKLYEELYAPKSFYMYLTPGRSQAEIDAFLQALENGAPVPVSP